MLGKKFYESDVPRIARAIEKVAAEMERANDLKEKELGIKGEEDEK
jgi:hypothetical protein